MTRAAGTDRAAKAAIYLEAARLLELRAPSVWNQEPILYTCEAIDTVLGATHAGDRELCPAMRDVFDPNKTNGFAWLQHISSEDGDEEDDRDGRILALCFMAAMVEAGDA